MFNKLKQGKAWFSGKRILLLILVVPIALLGSAIYRFAKQDSRMQDEFERQIRITAFNEKITLLRLYIKNAESAERGYAISGDPKFAENFDAFIDSINTIYSGIRQLETNSTDPVDAALLLRSDSLVKQKIAFMQQVKLLGDKNNIKEATALIETGRGLYLADSLTKINKQISRNMQEQVKQSQAAFLQTKRKNSILAYISFIASILLIILIFYLLILEIRCAEKITEELDTRKENYRVTLNSLGEGLISTDKEGNITYMNPSAELLTGWKWQEAKNQPLDRVFHVVNEKTGRKIENIVKRILEEGQKSEWENNTLLKARNAGTFVINNCGSPIFDAKGSISGAVLVFNDITEKQRAANAIKESETRYKDLVENISDLICTHDLDGRVLSMNRAAEKMLGFKFDPQANFNIKDILTTETKKKYDDYIHSVLKNGQMRELMKVKLSNGDIRIWEFNNSLKVAGEKSPVIRGYARDITDRKKAEKELRIAHQRLTSHLNNSPLAIIEWDKDLIIKNWTTRAENIFGWSKAEVLNKHFKDFNLVFEGDAAAVAVIAGELMQGTVNSNKSINRNNTKSGKVIHCQWFNSVLKDERGNILSIQSLILDITEQVKADEKIKQLSQAVEQSSASVVITDTNGNIEYVNQKFVELTGYSAAEAIGKNPRILKSGYTSAREYKNLWEQISSGLKWRGELHNKKRNGELYWESALISPVLAPDGKITHFLAIKEDITQRKENEARLKEALDRYDILAQATSDTIWDWDLVNKKMLYNNGITEMFGYQAAEIENIVDWWKDKLHPEDFEKVAESLSGVFEKKLQRVQLTYRYRCADGSYKHILDRAFILFDDNGEPCRMIGAMQDITYYVQEDIRISKATMDAHEDERHHIGEELHDNVNQILAGSLLTLGMAKEHSNDRRKSSDFIEMARGYISYAIDEIRKLSHQLVVVKAENNSLKELFENLLLNINLDNRFSINLHFDEFDEKLIPDDVQINLYRILQEQTKNIMKYSEASTLDVTVALAGETVSMKIIDDGKGFDTRAKKKGIGLSNIRKRAESLSGKFFLNSAPGEGCEIAVEIPLVQ